MVGRDQPAVVVADDDPALRLLCRVNLEHEGYRVLEAESAGDVERAVTSDAVALVLLDVHLGADDGVAVARGIRARHPEVAVAFFSGSAPQLPPSARALADAFLPKPFNLEDLTATVRRLARS